MKLISFCCIAGKKEDLIERLVTFEMIGNFLHTGGLVKKTKNIDKDINKNTKTFGERGYENRLNVENNRENSNDNNDRCNYGNHVNTVNADNNGFDENTENNVKKHVASTDIVIKRKLIGIGKNTFGLSMSLDDDDNKNNIEEEEWL